jgi:uncharacterized lipoprotein YddW (UPF0748 family)
VRRPAGAGGCSAALGPSIRFPHGAGFRGGPPGPAWIRLENASGVDSLAFTIEPLAHGDSLTETRALWVSRFEYSSREDLIRIMAQAGEAGFNLVYLQVRGRADAFYRSAHEPWAHNLTGVLGRDPGWDPLEVAVGEARRWGVEPHAWINAFTGWAGSTPPPVSEPLHAFLEHPEWVMVAQDGTPMPYQSGSRWLTPGHPGVRTRMAAVAADIARNYEVGGIHLDYIRYPDPGYSFDAVSLLAYDSARTLEPGLGFDEMRRRFVTMAVAETRDSLKAVDPDADLSAAVWGIFRNDRGWSGVSTGYGSVLQDARAWDRLGMVDGLAPMVHWPMTPDYGERLDFAYPADEHAGLPDPPGMRPGCSGKTAGDDAHSFHHPVHLLGRGVDADPRPNHAVGMTAQPPHDRCGVEVAVRKETALLVGQARGHVPRAHALDGKREGGRPIPARRGTVEAYCRNGCQTVPHAFQERTLPGNQLGKELVQEERPSGGVGVVVFSQ